MSTRTRNAVKAGLAAYRDALPTDAKVWWGPRSGGVFVVAKIQRDGSLKDLSPLLAAETKARRAADAYGGASFTFEVVDTSVGDFETKDLTELMLRSPARG